MKDSNSEKKDKIVRKDFVLPFSVVDKLSELRSELYDTTNSNVISLSITVLDQLIKAKVNGEDIYILDKEGVARQVLII